MEKLSKSKSKGIGKKLEDAAAAWARGGASEKGITTDDEYREQLRFLGTPDEEIEKMLSGRADRKRQGLLVMEPNRHAVLVFLRLQTQWDRAGMGGERCGLNYSRISYVIKQMGIKDREPIIFGQLQIMEMAALKEFARQAERRRKQHGN